MMKVVILAGGKGTRFWPKSVEEKPKQFLNLVSDQTMLQLTYHRFSSYIPAQNIFIVTTKSYLSLVLEQLPEINPGCLIIEPEPRDTGPCIALAALHFLRQNDDEVIVTTPSDHYVADEDRFFEALFAAEEIAKLKHSIVTLGIKPTRPETGYGYIETTPSKIGDRVLSAKSFIEKPPLEQALSLFNRPDIFWNSGIFIWKPSTISHYMKLHQKDMWNLLADSPDPEQVYARLPKISIDYAIMEHADEVYTIPAAFSWDDLGSWSSLQRVHAADKNGNVTFGDVHVVDTANSIIYSELFQTITVGMRDCIIVATENGFLVCHKSAEQRIKEIFKEIPKEKEDTNH